MVNELVKKLSTGKHNVTIGNRNESYSEIEKRIIDVKHIHITFPNTKGGTELGINIDTESCDLTKADFNKGEGKIHIEGRTNLNYCDVKCIADVDLKSREGKGNLVVVQ